MKIGRTIKFQARAFVDASAIANSLMDVAQMPLATSTGNVIAFTEADGQVVRQRFGLSEAKDNWNLTLGTSFFDFVQASPFDDLVLARFLDLASGALTEACNHFVRRPHRLALVISRQLAFDDEAELTRVRSRFLVPVPPFTDDDTFEWGWRSAIRQQLGFGAGLTEQCNVIVQVARANLEIIAPGGMVLPSESGVFLETDVNTAPEDSRARFDPSDIRPFFNAAGVKHDELWKHVARQMEAS